MAEWRRRAMPIDAASRLATLIHDLDGTTTTNDVGPTFTYNLASHTDGDAGAVERCLYGHRHC